MNRWSEIPYGIAGFLAILLTWSLWAKGDFLHAGAATACIILLLLAHWIDQRQKRSQEDAIESIRQINNALRSAADDEDDQRLRLYLHPISLQDAARNATRYSSETIASIAEREGDLELAHLAKFGGLSIEQLRSELRRRYSR